MASIPPQNLPTQDAGIRPKVSENPQEKLEDQKEPISLSELLRRNGSFSQQRPAEIKTAKPSNGTNDEKQSTDDNTSTWEEQGGLKSLKSAILSSNNSSRISGSNFPKERLEHMPFLRDLTMVREGDKIYFEIPESVTGIEEKSVKLNDKIFQDSFEKVFKDIDIDLEKDRFYFSTDRFSPDSAYGGITLAGGNIFINNNSVNNDEMKMALILGNEMSHKVYDDYKQSLINENLKDLKGFSHTIMKLKLNSDLDDVFSNFVPGANFGKPISEEQANEFVSDSISINIGGKTDIERLANLSSGKQAKDPKNNPYQGYDYTLKFAREKISDILISKGYTTEEAHNFFDDIKHRKKNSEVLFTDYGFNADDTRSLQNSYITEAQRILAHLKENLPKHIIAMREKNENIEDISK